MRISDWSADVCSSDLPPRPSIAIYFGKDVPNDVADREKEDTRDKRPFPYPRQIHHRQLARTEHVRQKQNRDERRHRSEEHTSELQSLMRNSYAVVCSQKTKTTRTSHKITQK